MSGAIPTSVLSQYLRSALGSRRVLAGVFMAFTFEPEFFEQEIMTLLAGDDLSQEPKLRLLQLQELLRADIGPVAVYYDQSGLRPDGPARLDVRYLPVRVRSGLFHPKVILLLTRPSDGESSEPETLLCGVLSANLTKNGWWASLECAHFETVTAQEKFAFREDLLGLLKDARALSGRAEGHDALDFIAKWIRRETSSSEHATLNGRLRTRLLAGTRPFVDFVKEIREERLTGSSLEIISPFFDDADPHPLRDLVTDLRLRETRVFLPTALDGSAICTKEIFEGVRNTRNTSWASIDANLLRLGKDANATKRGVHAKVYRFTRKTERYEALVVGSHNLTKPAHQKGGNFEASFFVERDEPGAVDWWLEVSERRPGAFKPELMDQADDEAAPGTVPLQISYDWKEKKAEARWDGDGPSPLLQIAATGAALFPLDLLSPREWLALDHESAAALERTLVSTSILTVTTPDGVVGTILVQESGMSRKPSIVASFSIADILAYWSRLTAADKAAYLETHFQGMMPEEWTVAGDLPKALTGPRGFFETFSGIFHGFEMLRQQVEETLAAGAMGKADYLLFGTWHDSLPHMIQKALETAADEPLNRYLILLCAQQMLEEMLRTDERFYREHRKETRQWLKTARQTGPLKAALQLDVDGERFLEWFEPHFLKRVEAVAHE